MARSSLPTTRLVIGASALLLGVLLMLDNLHVIYAADYLAYWPALLVVLGLVKFMQPGPSGKAWGVVLVVVGALLLLRTLDLYYIRFRDFWPLLLILVGGAMLWGTFVRRKVSTEGVVDEALLNGTAILGSFKRTITSQDFRGGDGRL